MDFWRVSWRSRQNRLDEALAAIDGLLAWLDRIGVTYYLPEAHWLRSQVLRCWGGTRMRLRHWQRALRSPNQPACAPGMADAERSGRANASSGNATEAQQVRSQARDLFEIVLSHTCEPSLRTSLIARWATLAPASVQLTDDQATD